MQPAAPTPTQKLLQVAGEHLRRFGRSRTTVTAIAQDAGMTHANVYRYFTSKNALIDAVSAQWLRKIEDALVASADAPDPADDKLERMVLEIARGYRDRAERDPALFDVFVDAVHKGRPVARKHRLRLNALIERVIDEGISAGTFGRERRRAAQLVFDVTHRFIDPVSVRGDLETPRAAMEARFERVVGALLPALRGRQRPDK